MSTVSFKEQRFSGRKLFTALCVHLVLIFIGLIVAIPLYWSVISSLTTNDLLFKDLSWIPTALHFENFSNALQGAPFGRYFINSLVVAVAVTIITLLTSALAGYGFAKFQFPGQKLLFGVVIAALMIPVPATMIPSFILVKQLGWLNSYAGLIIPCAVSGFGIFMIRQFMLSIPDALFEAAKLDGCNELQVFWFIVAPLARASLVALAVITFLGSWNNFIWPLLIVQNPNMMTLPLGLIQFKSEYTVNYTQLLAASLVIAAPVVILYLLMRRQIISSFASSGVKG
ncbi:MAG TPA: carbohydrate ABC transporter permease [Ktedonobacteraceae bacterium]